MYKRFIFTIVVAILSLSLSAQNRTVEWKAKPIYQSIKPYSASLYLCQLNGKWGVINSEGQVILRNSYDFIIAPHENIGIFGVSVGTKYRIEGLLYTNGKVITVDGSYFADVNCPFFSEGKLCVSDASGNYGYLDAEGKLVIKCRFAEIHPFKEGLASVRNKNRVVYYINDKYEDNPSRNVVYCQWNSGKILFGTSFKDGEAVVGYGGKYRVINNEGRDLRPYKAPVKVSKTDHTIMSGYDIEMKYGTIFKPVYTHITAFYEGGKYGLTSNNNLVVYPTFDNATSVDQNMNSIVSLSGQIGLLRVINGDVAAYLLENGKPIKEIHVNSNEASHKISYEVSLLDLQKDNASLYVNRGDGSFIDVTSSVSSQKNKWLFDFVPEIKKSQKQLCFGCKLVYAGIELLNQNDTLVVNRPETILESELPYTAVKITSINIQVSKPRVLTNQADIKTEIQEVATTISNLSNRNAKIKLSLSVKCKLNKPVSNTFSLAIPANSSKDIIVPVRVMHDEDVPAVVSCESCEDIESIVKLRIY